MVSAEIAFTAYPKTVRGYEDSETSEYHWNIHGIHAHNCLVRRESIIDYCAVLTSFQSRMKKGAVVSGHA
jgi:hypothetical protein